VDTFYTPPSSPDCYSRGVEVEAGPAIPQKAAVQSRELNPLAAIRKTSTSSAISSVLPNIRKGSSNLTLRSLPLLNTGFPATKGRRTPTITGRKLRMGLSTDSVSRTRSISPRSSTRNLRPISTMRKLRQRPTCSIGAKVRARSRGSKLPLRMRSLTHNSGRTLSPSSVRSLPSTRSLRHGASRRNPSSSTFSLTPDALFRQNKGKDLKDESYWTFPRTHEGGDATKRVGSQVRKASSISHLPVMNDRRKIKGDLVRNQPNRIHPESEIKNHQDLPSENPLKSSVPTALSHEEMIAARTKIFSEIRLVGTALMNFLKSRKFLTNFPFFFTHLCADPETHKRRRQF